MYIVMYCDMSIKEELKDEHVIKRVYYIYKISTIKDKIAPSISVMMESAVLMAQSALLLRQHAINIPFLLKVPTETDLHLFQTHFFYNVLSKFLSMYSSDGLH